MEADLPSWGLVALLLVGMAAGFINVLAGGGSLLTMPLLIFLGLPEGVANGTTRVAILIQNTTAVWRYRKAGRLQLGLVRRLCPPALIGAGAGAAAAVWLGDAGFRTVLGWVMLACALLVAANPAFGKQQDATEPEAAAPVGTLRVWAVMLCIGFYGGLVQAGVGYLILFGLTYVLRMKLVEANIMKVVVVLSYTPLALSVFISQDQVAWLPGLLLAGGQAAGAALGTAVALQRGAQLIRLSLAIVVAISAARLLL